MPNDFATGVLDNQEPAPVNAELLDALKREGIAVDVSIPARAAHGRDWWPLTIADVYAGRIPHWPAVVARATSRDDVVAIMQVAAANSIAVTAQGGRWREWGWRISPAPSRANCRGA